MYRERLQIWNDDQILYYFVIKHGYYISHVREVPQPYGFDPNKTRLRIFSPGHVFDVNRFHILDIHSSVPAPHHLGVSAPHKNCCYYSKCVCSSFRIIMCERSFPRVPQKRLQHHTEEEKKTVASHTSYIVTSKHRILAQTELVFACTCTRSVVRHRQTRRVHMAKLIAKLRTCWSTDQKPHTLAGVPERSVQTQTVWMCLRYGAHSPCT